MSTITIKSSIVFPDELKSTVEQKLSTKLEVINPTFLYEVDSSLIAGFQVIYGDTELHYDLKSEIEHIQNELV